MDAQEENSAVSVNDDLAYPIVVAPDVRVFVRSLLTDRDVRRLVVLCDANPAVVAIARRVTRGLPGLLGVVPIQLGERRKRLSTLELVLERLLSAGTDRQTLVLGVGGGVASDLFGFAAATYMRGVPYAHVATSLVAMVDAAVGGKTGVDLAGGKNLAGVFSDPVAVFAPADAIDTLPFRHLREGLAETVKHAVIEGNDLFDALEELAAHPFSQWPWPAVIAGSTKVKTMIVADDRTELGARETLNLGHTFAHGIERASNYRISHGAAVSLGLRAAGLLALRLRRFARSDHLRMLTLLALLRLPLVMPLRPAAVLAAMQADKKKRDGRLRFVLPNAIGDVEYGIEAPDRMVLDVLGHLTRPPQTFESR
ncbi:MAG TPA: 3-dehydroquinate synthase family protein [Verrucomicrobiae bacterium]|nr:3-dehydroquinate synthase family protein [Verrucomicrobiae bacterium]